LSNNSVRFDNKSHGPNSRHVFVGSMVSLVTLLTCFELISALDMTAFASICFFNFLFVFLLFPLQGAISHKIMLLLAGNVVGVVWHFFIITFENVFVYFSNTNFKIMFLIFSPLANFMWIVSLWSISLSVIAKNKPRKNQFWEQN
jgi:hypothetical protein